MRQTHSFLKWNFFYKACEFSSKSDEKMLGACSACYSQIQEIPILRISKCKTVQECGALARNSHAQKTLIILHHKLMH